MWLRTCTLSFFALCLECSLLLNVSASDAELTSSLLSKASEWNCASDAECTISDSSCVNGFCECNGDHIYNTDMTACILAAAAYGDNCTETIQCSSYLLTGSVCSNGICTCNEGYHYTHGRCYASAALGEACIADANCYVWADNEASSCVNGICVCSEGFYAREYRGCRRASYAVGDSCAIDLDCQFENGYCDTSSFDANSYVCALRDATRNEFLDSSAYETEDEVHAESRIVKISARADANVTVGTECASNNDCTLLANSKCGAAGLCVCNRAYYASDDMTTCIPEIGETCSSVDESDIDNAVCRDNSWTCGHSTVASINQKICRKSTKNYGYSCLHDEQCYIFGPDASCQKKRCRCKAGSHIAEDLKFCWVSRGIGESCRANEDCYVENPDLELSCTDSVCTCPPGTNPNTDKTSCKDSNAVLGDTCEEDTDCVVKNSACIDSTCVCPINYLEANGHCEAGVNAACSSDSDCVVDNSTCAENNVCQCIESYVSDATDSCLPIAGHGEECESDIQCSTVTSNARCSVASTPDDDSNSTATSYCECESDYHYRFGVCNYKIAIGQSCKALGDCYVASGEDDVVCRKGVCACSWDSSAENRTSCTRVASDATSFFLSTWLVTLLLGGKILVPV